MADPRSTSTRRAVLSYNHLKELTGWKELIIEDYQGILEDFVYVTDEIDNLEITVNENTEAIESLSERVEVLEGEIDGIKSRLEVLEGNVFEVINTDTSLTAEAFKVYNCTNTSRIDITLNASPSLNDMVHIKRSAGIVRVIGGVDGKTNKTINVKGYSMLLIFNGTDWSQI